MEKIRATLCFFFPAAPRPPGCRSLVAALWACHRRGACVIRRQDDTLQAYEAGIIRCVVLTNAASSAMMWCTLFKPPRKWPLFAALVVVTVVLDFYAAALPAVPQLRQWKDMNACIDKFGIANPVNGRIPAMIAVAVLALGVFLAWLYLGRKSGWGKSSPLVRIYTFMCPGSSQSYDRHDLTINGRKFKGLNQEAQLAAWGAAAYIILAMMFFEGAAAFFFYIMLILRNKAANFLTGKWQENEWGLGQVIAPFSWAPLLVELGGAVFESI